MEVFEVQNLTKKQKTELTYKVGIEYYIMQDMVVREPSRKQHIPKVNYSLGRTFSTCSRGRP